MEQSACVESGSSPPTFPRPRPDRPGRGSGAAFGSDHSESLARKEVTEQVNANLRGQPLLLKAEEVALLLGLGRSKVYGMIASGELPVTRIGTAVRVPRAQLENWVDDHTAKAA